MPPSGLLHAPHPHPHSSSSSLTPNPTLEPLRSLNHPHIVNVSEVVVGPSLDAVFMVMEYCDHDLKAGEAAA